MPKHRQMYSAADNKLATLEKQHTKALTAQTALLQTPNTVRASHAQAAKIASSMQRTLKNLYMQEISLLTPPLEMPFYRLNALSSSLGLQSSSTALSYTSWLILTVRSYTSTYSFSHSLSTLKTRSRLRPGSSASPKCLSTRFLRASMPLRISLPSLEWRSFLNMERECDDRIATVWGVEPGCVRSVSVDSTNSWGIY